MLQAYVDRADLTRLLDHRLSRRLNDYVGDIGMRDAVAKLLRVATAEGWCATLVDAVLLDKSGNHELRAWAANELWVSAEAAALAPTPELQLANTAFFDLHQMRRQITQAKYAADSKLLAFGVEYPEDIFITKLCDWLPSCLGNLQLKGWLSLRPERSSVDERIKHATRYLEEVTSGSVLCRVFVDRVPTDSVEAFWSGVRAYCGEPDYWFVFIFAGELTEGYPPGITVLDRPRFDRVDLILWAQEVATHLKWPAVLAEAWCQLIVERAGDEHHLDVRVVYEEMDRSIRAARHDPVGFRRTLERMG
jgi:hypothetical protein